MLLRRLFLSLVLIVVCAGKNVAAEPDAGVVARIDNLGAEFPWVHKGILFSLITNKNGFNISRTVLYENKESGAVISLNGALDNISRVVWVETAGVVDDNFLRKNLADFLELCVLQGKRLVLTRELRDTIDGGLKQAGAVQPRNWVRLREYCTGRVTALQEKTWSVTFNVITPEGGIERWDISGERFPFAILKATLLTVEKSGSFDDFPRS